MTSQLNAQTMKGNWLLGGNVSFNSYHDSRDYSSKDFMLRLNVGFLALNNLAIGASVNIHNDGSVLLYEGGPFLRYYIINLGKHAKLLTQANISRHVRGLLYTTYGGGVGISYFLNPHLALEGTVGYSTRSYDTFDQSRNTIGVYFGFQAHF